MTADVPLLIRLPANKILPPMAKLLLVVLTRAALSASVRCPAPSAQPVMLSLPGTEEERAAVALADHLRGRPYPDEGKARQRLGMFLVRRGFDADTVRTVLRRAAGEAASD